MKSHIILSLSVLLTFALSAGAQNARYSVNKYKENGSSYDDRLNMNSDMENFSRYTMRRFPSLVGWTKEKDSIPERNVNILLVEYSNDIKKTEHKAWESAHTSISHLMAGGEYAIKGVGILYGQASYSKEKEHDIFSNYTSRPADYYPYLVGDTVNIGNPSNERYTVHGGISLGKDKFRYGIAAYYEGIAAAKKNQPRSSVYNYMFRFSLSAAYTGNGSQLALKLYPEISHQSIRVSSSLLTYRYLQYYGFGMWNRTESPADYNYSREASIKGIGTELIYHHQPQTLNDWELMLTAGFNHRHMKTEEANFKNLFESKTNHISHSIFTKKRLGGNTTFCLSYQGMENMRDGLENVYQSIRQESEQELYNYEKVGTSKLYDCHLYDEQVRARISHDIFKGIQIGYFLGLNYFETEENYDMPKLNEQLQSYAPLLGASFKYGDKNNDFDIEITAKRDNIKRHATQKAASTYGVSVCSTEMYYTRTLRNGKQIGCEMNAILSSRHDSTFNIGIFYLF